MCLPSLFREFSETCVKLNYFISTEDVRGVVTHRVATMDEAAGLTVGGGGDDWGKIVRLSLAVQLGKDRQIQCRPGSGSRGREAEAEGGEKTVGRGTQLPAALLSLLTLQTG